MSAMDTDSHNGAGVDTTNELLQQWGAGRVEIDFDAIAKELQAPVEVSPGEVLLDALAQEGDEPPPASPGEEDAQSVLPRKDPLWHRIKMSLFPAYRQQVMMNALQASIIRRIGLMQVIGRPQDFHLGIGPRIKIAVVNTKGGVYKTTMVVHLASVLAEFTRRRTLVLDLNNNQGDAMRRLGIDPMLTLQLRQAYDDSKSLFASYGAATDLLPLTKHGVSIISRDFVPTYMLAANHKALKKLTGRVQMQELIDMAFANSGFLVIDNSNMLDDASNLAAITQADVLIFVGDAHEGSSLEQLHEALAFISTSDADLHRKVNERSLIALTGVRPAGLRQFALKIGFPGPCVAIPYDDVLRRGAPVDLDLIGRETLSAFVDVANHVLMMSRPDLTPPSAPVPAVEPELPLGEPEPVLTDSEATTTPEEV